MTTMSQRKQKMITRKILATNNKVLVCTGSLHFFKKYRQPIEKSWLGTSTSMRDSSFI